VLNDSALTFLISFNKVVLDLKERKGNLRSPRKKPN
jgi:hypothetical protein